MSAPVARLVQVDGPSLGPGDFVRTGRVLALIALIILDNSYARTRTGVVDEPGEEFGEEPEFTGFTPGRWLRK